MSNRVDPQADGPGDQTALDNRLVSNQAKSQAVRSPCVNVCALDAGDICVGCYRTGQEIATWGSMSNAQRLEVLRKVARREAESGRPL